ncbi:hypothetical protein ACLOJK_023758 [Asimina triloba]
MEESKKFCAIQAILLKLLLGAGGGEGESGRWRGSGVWGRGRAESQGEREVRDREMERERGAGRLGWRVATGREKEGGRRPGDRDGEGRPAKMGSRQRERGKDNEMEYLLCRGLPERRKKKTDALLAATGCSELELEIGRVRRAEMETGMKERRVSHGSHFRPSLPSQT